MKSLLQKPKWRTWLFVSFVLLFYFTRTRPPDPIQDIVLHGGYGFVAAGKDGVIVLDFYTDEDNPELLADPVFEADFNPSKFVHALEVDDDHVYVANDSDGLLVLSKVDLWPDVFPPSDDDEDKKKVIVMPTSGDVIDVAITEKFVYALDDNAGILIYKIKDLAEDLEPSGPFEIPGKAVKIKIFGSQLFVINDENQLLRYSINDPKKLEDQVIFEIESQINDFTLQGNNLYLATETNGFLIRENSPTAEVNDDWKFTDISPVYNVSLKGNYAFVAAGKEGFLVLSIKEPSTIVKIGQEKSVSEANLNFWIDDFVYVANGRDGLKTFEQHVNFDYSAKKTDIQQGHYHDVIVEDDIAYIAAGDFGLQVINVVTPSRPKNLFYKDIPITEDDKDEARALAIKEDSLYVAYKEEGVREFDISENKENPVKTENSYSTEGEANDLFIKDNFAYVAVGSAGLQIFDLNLEKAKGYTESTTGDALGVFVVDDYAYVADGNKGLQIIQVSDPQKPTQKNSVDTPGTATAVYVAEMKNAAGDKRLYAFVADGDKGLFLVDVTDPLGTLEGVSFETGEYANDLLVRGRTVYLVDKTNGLVTVHIPEDFTPQLQGKLPTPGQAKGLFLDDNLNFVADGDRGFRIIETEDKNNPVEIGFYDSTKNMRKIITDGTNSYLVDGDSGFWVLSLEDRNVPYPIAFYRTPGKATDLAMDEKFAYIADGKKGVYILNIEDPNSPKFAGTYDEVGKAISIAVDGINLYVGSDQNQMFILNAEDKKNVEEIAAYNTAGTPSQIVVHDGYTYISEGEKGLEIVYVDDPDDLDSFIANEEYGMTDTRFVAVMESGNLVKMNGYQKSDANDIILVADGKNGLKIYDIYRPFKPGFIAEFPMDEGGEARSVSAVDEYAFLSAGDQGLLTYYIWDLNRITLVGEETSESLPQTGVIAALSSVDEKFRNKKDSIGDNRYHNYVYAADEALHTFQVNGKSDSEYRGEYELIGEATLRQILDQSVNALIHRDPSLIQEKVITRIQYVIFGIFVLVFVSSFWLFFLSRFILPIRTTQDWRKALSRLWDSLWGSHGPAILVKGGRLASKSSELERIGRGVARLDFNSAVVLERRAMTDPGLRRYYYKFKERAKRQGIKLPRSHAESTGVVFIRPFETIRGYADIRTQFRIRPEVQAYTRDGIEVNNPVWVLFTLGQPPEILDVTYEGARIAENLRVINADDEATITKDDGKKQRGLFVKELVDELDESDKEEIHLFVQKRILSKFFQRVKTIILGFDLTRAPEEVIEEFVEHMEFLISRYEIDERKRIQKFMEEVSQIVAQSKRDGTIDLPTLEWFAYRISALSDDYAFEGMTTFHQIVYSIKMHQYIHELQEMSYPKDLVDYAQQRIDQFFKRHKGDDENREFILTAFRIKFIVDREINRYLENLEDNLVDEVKKEQLILFKKKIATNTNELIRTEYPFIGLYGLVAKLYDCVKVANQIATQITISDEWRFPNMGDLFKIRDSVREIQERLEAQENACKLEFERYLDLVIFYDYVSLTRQQLKILRLANTKEEKNKTTETCVDLLQKEINNLDRITDPAYQKEIKKLKNSVLSLDKNNSSEVFFFLKQVNNLWQKIKSADILIIQSFLRKSQKQFDLIQKNVRKFSKLARTGDANGEVQQYQDDIASIQKQLKSCPIPKKLLTKTPPKREYIGPYLFDRQRIVAAVYSEAQDKDREEFEDQQMHWSNLPVHVAAQTFRDLVSMEQYNYLYRPDDPNKYNLPKLKANLRMMMRNQGVLAFRFVDHVDGLPLESGNELEPDDLVYYKNRELKNPKILRSRGIKVIASGFPDLFPVSIEMPSHQLEQWKAPWQRDTAAILSQAELRAIRMINKTRSQAQREMAYNLARIMQASRSEEALAIRVFQALEAVAADQDNRQFLPRDTMHLLYRFRQWFIDTGELENGDSPDSYDFPNQEQSPPD